ncbi:zf-HC2 domain-containing protein [Halalkalibacter kiskunsagensis]|uniref:Zf-HC2 domain-containing protein n=1 Tax=Halalkalibacter kiskunsagensis TaxID=1548599 RepID=A0ABV6KCN0_9BACI
MKCSLIRDLLPLYVEGDCSKDTSLMVKEHLESCSDCGELYELMKSPIDIKVIDQPVATGSKDGIELWKKYYGRLILKGTGLFLCVYIAVVMLILLLK